MKTQAKLLVGKLLLAGLLVAPLAARGQAVADLEVRFVDATGSTPALPFLSDFPIFGRRDPNPGQITYGQVKRYTVRIANLGPSTAVGVEIAQPTVDANLVVVGASGCVLRSFVENGETIIDPSDSRSWPCRIGSIPDFGSATMRFDVFWPFPVDPLTNEPPQDDPDTPQREDAPTTCPTTVTLDPTAVNVSTAGPGATTDPATGNNTPTDTPVSGPQAWLRIALASDVAAGGPGTQFTVTGTVTNDGPCTAVRVKVADRDFTSDGKMSFVPGQTTGCVGIPNDPTTPNDDETVLPVDINLVSPGCTLDVSGGTGDLALGASATFSGSYIVGSMGSDELQRATNVSLNAYSGGRAYLASRPAEDDGRTFDPDETDNVSSVKVISSQSVSGCSTGGIPGALGLLLLGLPLLRRRRR